MYDIRGDVPQPEAKPQPERQHRVIDAHGEVVEERGCPRCDAVQMDDVENLQGEVRRLLRRIDRLERDEDEKRRKDPYRGKILRVIEHWKTATGHPKARDTADRFDVVKARFNEGYTEEQLLLAVDGIAALPYVGKEGRKANGTRKERHDRLGIALGGGEAVERFANIGAEWRAWKERQATAEKPAP